MKIDDIPNVLNNFVVAVSPLLGRDLTYDICEQIQAGKFPDKYEKIVKGRKEGVYIFSSVEDGTVLYVGKSVDVVNRFWEHKGTNFAWERDGHLAKFPNCSLIDQRHWLDEKVHKLFQDAKFNVTFIFPNHADLKGLIEVYLICYAKPPVNVDNK